MLVALVAVSIGGYAQPTAEAFRQGQALGASGGAGIGSQIGPGAGSTTVPHYSDAQPQSGFFAGGAGSLVPPGAAQALVWVIGWLLTIAAGLIWFAIALITVRHRTLHDLVSGIIAAENRRRIPGAFPWDRRPVGEQGRRAQASQEQELLHGERSPCGERAQRRRRAAGAA